MLIKYKLFFIQQLVFHTFPGMKQHSLVSINRLKAMDNIESRVSIATSISHFLDKGCFRRSDSRRGKSVFTAFNDAL